MSAVDSLMEMGFPRNRAEKALAVTGNQGVPAAMDWLFAHADDADIDEPYVAPQGHRLADAPSSTSSSDPVAEGQTAASGDSSTSPAAESTESMEACSLKCDECGKQLRDAMAAQAHAERTGHSQFSESTEKIKPLTEEEKEAQKKRLQERLVEKRRMRLEEEKKSSIEAEKMRRKSGKNVSDAKDKFEHQRKLQDAEARRREKEEDRKAKEAILAKIAADKAERAAAKTRAAAPADNATRPRDVGTSVDAPPVKKQYTECRIRVRLPDGQAVMQTFAPSDKLTTVVSFVRNHYAAGAFSLKIAMPPKTFCGPDMDQTLQSLGLMPSATLMVIKA